MQLRTRQLSAETEALRQTAGPPARHWALYFKSKITVAVLQLIAVGW